jgi:hypothetical protein
MKEEEINETWNKPIRNNAETLNYGFTWPSTLKQTNSLKKDSHNTLNQIGLLRNIHNLQHKKSEKNF